MFQFRKTLRSSSSNTQLVNFISFLYFSSLISRLGVNYIDIYFRSGKCIAIHEELVLRLF